MLWKVTASCKEECQTLFKAAQVSRLVQNPDKSSDADRRGSLLKTRVRDTVRIKRVQHLAFTK